MLKGHTTFRAEFERLRFRQAIAPLPDNTHPWAELPITRFLAVAKAVQRRILVGDGEFVSALPSDGHVALLPEHRVGALEIALECSVDNCKSCTEPAITLLYRIEQELADNEARQNATVGDQPAEIVSDLDVDRQEGPLADAERSLSAVDLATQDALNRQRADRALRACGLTQDRIRRRELESVLNLKRDAFSKRLSAYRCAKDVKTSRKWFLDYGRPRDDVIDFLVWDLRNTTGVPLLELMTETVNDKPTTSQRR